MNGKNNPCLYAMPLTRLRRAALPGSILKPPPLRSLGASNLAAKVIVCVLR